MFGAQHAIHDLDPLDAGMPTSDSTVTVSQSAESPNCVDEQASNRVTMTEVAVSQCLRNNGVVKKLEKGRCGGGQ